jgi:hypothetical protein
VVPPPLMRNLTKFMNFQTSLLKVHEGFSVTDSKRERRERGYLFMTELTCNNEISLQRLSRRRPIQILRYIEPFSARAR